MILRLEDFLCEARIAGLFSGGGLESPANSAIRSGVEDYIAKYEPQFIRDFGMPQSQYADLDAYAEQVEQDDEMKNAVIRRLRFSLSHYVSYWWLRSQTVTPIGGVELGSENGKRISTADTQAMLWNQMAENSLDLYHEMYRKGHPDTEVFRHINSMGL